MRNVSWRLSLGAAAILLAASHLPAQVNVFATTFDSGAPAQISGVTSTESVQGFAGLGPAGDQFGGNFLRSTASGNGAAGTGAAANHGSPTTLTLSGLPAHTSINIGFLLGMIDSWDGTGNRFGAQFAPDFFNVTVDGNPVFSQTFANVSGSNPSYPPASPPPGLVLLYPNGTQTANTDVFNGGGGFSDDRATTARST
jgi:hypothetical protein